MKVGIYGQFYHQDAGKYIQELLDELDRAQIDVIIEENFLDIINHHETIKKEYNHFSTFEELDDSYDLFFSIGGDGTILKTIYYVRHHNIPIVGINTGRLGFLATIQKEEIKESISHILSGDYSISKRSVLQINSEQEPATINDFNFALNEIAVSRRNTTSMITVETWLNDNYLNAYWADGLIVSTPTGSTGYSLSCGGPVIMPDTQNFVLTPIAPHNLNARPLIIKDDTKIKLKVSTREDTFLVSMDSRIATLQKNSVLTVQKAPFQIHLVELNGSSFPKTLRKKLLWGQDKRN
ncbi:NAD kinase [Croceibacter atlanticus]|jgi:NAD+ kinase|uniref:NAD kinase n=1 Tax=Croceibacter atlanticus (strain ATCC BAA-628 / JCM 21780 / CIP 108009 / IAM 15332 / KCTC 12090 / HTCC2559) TaxID=216432 RepID=A3U6T8_CROAH|nr:NAD kinase [Croceibacter atlanticus]MAM23316.1 NAD kinase [Croceibacter sp.]HAT70866.1 NAD kinase [Flavobacteriaceae bacterium]EAP87955.1 ATP-NAD kinase [Croceibacter atlanticus HTCC2559]MBW4969838.1 NAD kinase [Croceibacter atlanticus]WSP35596.1 NAD kinase [Croceibacter atlanticus]|tara:strand:+ start:261810 stop:262694 length:885 start_codon:yes stop_codon:yes gene_type:complete